MIQNMPLVDFHMHFPVQGDWFPDYDMPGKVEFDSIGSRDHGETWRKAFNFPHQEAAKTDAEMAKIYSEDLIKKGVDRAFFVSGGGNDRLASIVNMYPKQFVGFAHHHPDSPNAAQELEHALGDLKLKGYKLLGPLVDTNLSDPKYYPLWEICQHYNVPVLIHFGLLGAAGGTPDGENISPMSIAKVSRAFPQLNFVVPHFGCTHIEDLLQVCWTRPNVYVDTSGSNQWVRWMPYPLTLENIITKFVQTVGPGRILFGSDSSWMPRGFASIYLEEQHKAFRFMNLDDNEMELIFSKNALRLIGEA